MSNKNISVKIGVQQIESRSLLEKDLRDALQDYSESIGIPIDYDYGKVENDIWDRSRGHFDLIDDLPNVIQIEEIWIPKTERRNGYGTNIIEIILNLFAKKSLIFAEAGVFQKEYPSMKWTTNRKNNSGKKVVPINKVREVDDQFLGRNGFVNVTELISTENNKFKYIFSNPIGAFVENYIESSLVTFGRMTYKVTTRVYSAALYDALQIGDGDDNYIFPLYVLGKKREAESDSDIGYDTIYDVPFDEDLVDDLKDMPWYSGFDTNGETNIQHEVAIEDMKYLKYIGGQECEVLDEYENCLVNYPCIFIDNPVLAELDSGVTAEYYYLNSPDHTVVSMYGKALMENGVWAARTWYYDVEENIIYDDYTENDPACAYVGYIACVVEAEDPDEVASKSDYDEDDEEEYESEEEYEDDEYEEVDDEEYESDESEENEEE